MTKRQFIIECIKAALMAAPISALVVGEIVMILLIGG